MTISRRLLQVCNVGHIVGGTAACAWSIARSLPEYEHHIAFLSPISAETRAAFRECRLYEWQRIMRSDIARCDPDAVILHNTPTSRWNAPLGVPTIRYVHSLSPLGYGEDTRWYCSRWLAERCGDAAGKILLQGVPRPLKPIDDGDRGSRAHLVIGRLCTPQLRKWPRELIAFYGELCSIIPDAEWEFIGCPPSLHDGLFDACRGKAALLPASWTQRSLFWRWDALLYHHPTLTESFGRTTAEAMRAGCIPLVDARGGFVEQIVPGTGFLCRDIDEFAAGVLAIADESERRRRSASCRVHADREFSFVRFGSDLRRLLSSTL